MCCSMNLILCIQFNTETPDERPVRMSANRLRHCAQHEINPQAPHFHQHAVYSKLTKFHSALASLQFHTCSTCAEHFPNLNVVPASDGTMECRRCNQDKYIPKVYPSANNMKPGPLPQQLQVSISFVYYWNLTKLWLKFIVSINCSF